MKVVLAAIHPYPSPQAVPLANAFLKAYLATDEELSEKVDISLCDFISAQSADTCVDSILALVPDVVGFSMYLWNRDKCIEIAAAIRRRRPNLTIFAGGPEPTADPAGVLPRSPFDFLIIGEGEITFIEVLGRLNAGRPLSGVKGVAVHETGGCDAEPRGNIGILDTIPSPYLSGILEAKRSGGVLWQLSRGCEFSCDFCFDHQGGKGVRRFSMGRIAAELEHFVTRDVTQVFVLDSTFNLEAKRAKQILRLIKRIAPHIHFHFEVRSEFIDVDMARLFAQLTCSLQIGLQSADPQVHKRVRRMFNPGDFIRKIELLNDAGAVFGFDLIYGLPGDTLQGFTESLDFAIGLFPNHLDIFPLAVLPGTRLASKADLWRIRHQTRPPYLLQSSTTFSSADMEKAAGLATACDIFYSRGKAVAWFNAVVAPLKLAPSAFLMEFNLWLTKERGTVPSETDLSDDDIFQAQRDFVHRMFTRKKLRKLLPAALDLISYHYCYASALLSPPPLLPTDRELEQMDLLQQPFLLAPSARLGRFNHDIFVILEAGDLDLREFTECFTPQGSYAVIYPRGGEVFTESLSVPYFSLLTLLDGATPAGRIAATLAIPSEEAVSFLEFAAAEGFITLRSWQATA